jgi:hypothetical protein
MISGEMAEDKDLETPVGEYDHLASKFWYLEEPLPEQWEGRSSFINAPRGDPGAEDA